ncbi:LysR family transcriptional regulator [Amaricoccus tamworthensis]|uniref:LysR family transcriptional regulator n=1 Tax=Amaricoccus tamworthensis TaxID=57002 RepID=UPI003C7DB89E
MENLITRLQLRHVRLLHAIGRYGQISLAAEMLSVSQPAASRMLADIEKIVGQPLFARHPKGMTATSMGEILLRHAKKIVGDLEEAATDVEAFRAGRSGRVKVGAVTGPAVGFLVPAVQGLKKGAEFADITVDVAPSAELMAGLLRGDYDFVLARIPPDVDPRLLSIERGRVEEIRMLVRAGHPLAPKDNVTFADIADLVWLIQASGMPIREAVEQAFVNRNIPVPREIINTSSLMVSLRYLINTDAVAACSKEVVELLVNSGAAGWAALPMRETLILTPYHIIRLKGRSITPLGKRMLEYLKSELAF